jgi:hypothetical protein
MFVEIPPHIAVSDFVRRVKGRSSHRVQMEFPDLRKRYWGGALGATSPPPAATSRTMSYFSIFRSTNLPASAGGISELLAETAAPVHGRGFTAVEPCFDDGALKTLPNHAG